MRCQDFFYLSRRNKTAVIDYENSVTILLDFIEQVAGNKNCQTVVPDLLLKETEDFPRALRIHAVSRLIENQQSRPAQQGHAETKPLFHAV